MWLSWWGVVPPGRGLDSRAGAHTWVAGQGPSWGQVGEAGNMFLSLSSPSLPLSLINNVFKEKKKLSHMGWPRQRRGIGADSSPVGDKTPGLDVAVHGLSSS